MGKSDPLVFAAYSEILPKRQFDAVAFLGYRNENSFTTTIKSNVRHFYDIKPDNAECFQWNINDGFHPSRKYDLIAATRCPYFARNPSVFVDDCVKSLNTGGMFLCDWGLGDHWRFQQYKVGWRRNGEHEWAYESDNLLQSCLWNEEIANHEQSLKFWKHAKVIGAYDIDDLSVIVKDEVPAVCDYNYDFLRVMMLWPEAPQLYIITLTKK